MTQNAKPSPEPKSSVPDAPIFTDGQAPATSDSGMNSRPLTPEQVEAFMKFYKEFMDSYGRNDD